MLILFYNTMWGQPLEFPGNMPKDVECTTDRRRYSDASVVVFHTPEWSRCRWLFMPKKLPGQLWVAWSMECSENYAHLRNPRFLRQFDLTMTYRLDSDVPITYVSFYGSAANLARALRQPAGPKISEPLATAFISSRVNGSGRRQYLRQLARHLPIDSYGKFMRNRSLMDDRGRPSKLEAIGRYKFTLSFENISGHDYVTEKFFDPFVAGSLPVYLGAPNVKDFAPGEHCFINVADFPEPRSLAEYLKVLADDEIAYQSYFAWKEQPYRAEFQNFLSISERGSLVRLCELVCSRLTGDGIS